MRFSEVVKEKCGEPLSEWSYIKKIAITASEPVKRTLRVWDI
jgi:hypothetical protein